MYAMVFPRTSRAATDFTQYTRLLRARHSLDKVIKTDSYVQSGKPIAWPVFRIEGNNKWNNSINPDISPIGNHMKDGSKGTKGYQTVPKRLYSAQTGPPTIAHPLSPRLES